MVRFIIPVLVIASTIIHGCENSDRSSSSSSVTTLDPVEDDHDGDDDTSHGGAKTVFHQNHIYLQLRLKFSPALSNLDRPCHLQCPRDLHLPQYLEYTLAGCAQYTLVYQDGSETFQ